MYLGKTPANRTQGAAMDASLACIKEGRQSGYIKHQVELSQSVPISVLSLFVPLAPPQKNQLVMAVI